MSAPTVPFADFADLTQFTVKAQEQVSAGVRAWADAVSAATEDLTAERPAYLDPKAIVEKYFDTAQQVLDQQREVVKSFLATSTEAGKTVTEQAAAATKNVAAQTVTVVEEAAEKATAAVKAASTN